MTPDEPGRAGDDRTARFLIWSILFVTALGLLVCAAILIQSWEPTS